MARALFAVVVCLCMAVAFAADLRRLQADRAAGIAPQQGGKDGKGGGADLDSASSYGFGYYGGGPWAGPWSYGFGWGGYGPYGGWW